MVSILEARKLSLRDVEEYKDCFFGVWLCFNLLCPSYGA